MQVEQEVLLRDLTTFHIGGPATFYIRIRSIDELQQALDFARDKSLPVLILGGGSNILARDEGYDGLVLRIEIPGIAIDGPTVVVGAGESWDQLVARAVDATLWGLENLSGIPGTVGGAIVGGIGAYGAAVGEHLSWVEVFNTDTRATEKLSVSECAFGYRDSVFKHKKNLIVIRAAFGLSHEPAPNVSYKDLAAKFNDSSLDIAAIRDAVLDIRKAKFPDVSIEGTAGSFFKNPIVNKAEADALRARYPELPLFAMPEVSGYKVPLAWFLDYRHGVVDMRGVTVGGARTFEAQPLVIAAARGSTAHDVRELARMVAEKIFSATGLQIEAEVEIF